METCAYWVCSAPLGTVSIGSAPSQKNAQFKKKDTQVLEPSGEVEGMQWIERSTTIRADWEVAFALLLPFQFLINCYNFFVTRLFGNVKIAVRCGPLTGQEKNRPALLK